MSDAASDGVPAGARASAPAADGDRAAPLPPHTGTLARAVRAVSGVTVLSRLGGLVRDVLVVRLFGATALGSAFAAAFAIPNLFRRLLGEGALSAAFLPEYAQAHKHDPALADRLASLTVAALLLVTTALTVVIELALLLVVLLAPGSPERVLSLQLVMVMLPFMPLVCVAAILSGVLQVHGRFGPAASGPVVLNAFIIAVAAYYLFVAGRAGDESAAFAIGVATVLSGVTQCLWFARLLRGRVRWTRDWSPARDAARRMLRRFGPVLLGLGTLQINTFLDTLIAMWPVWVGPTIAGRTYPLDEASNVILTAAQRLYQFPLGVFGIAVATAVFPLLSRVADEREGFEGVLRRGLRLSLFIGLPASVGLLLVRDELIATFFSSGGASGGAPGSVSSGAGSGGVPGGFDAAAAERSSFVLAGFACGVWAYSLNHVLTRAFYARKDTRTPMRVSLAMVALNLVLNCTLIWFFREAGLAIATGVTAALQCVVLFALTRTKLGVRPLDGATLRGAGRVVLATALMGAGVWGVLQGATLAGVGGGAGSPWAHHAGRLALATIVGAGLYVLLALVLRMPELRWLAARDRRPASAPPAGDAAASPMSGE